MRKFVLSLFAAMIMAVSLAQANPTLEDYAKLSPREKEQVEREYRSSGRIEWRELEYFIEITPANLARRPVGKDPEWYLKNAPYVTREEAESVLKYVQRAELYSHDLFVLEAHLKNRFKNDSRVPSLAIFEISHNLKYAYQILKNYDINNDNKKDFSTRGAIAYLSLYFSQIRHVGIITRSNNPILKDFISNHLTTMNESRINDIISTLRSITDYYTHRLETASDYETTTIRKELHEITRSAMSFAERAENPFAERFFTTQYQNQTRAADKSAPVIKAEPIPEVTAEQLEEKRTKNLNYFKKTIANFIDRAGGSFKDPKVQIVFENGIVEVEFIKHFPIENGVVKIGEYRRIYTVRVIEANAHTTDAIYYATQALLDMKHLHGVYFDDKLKIPSKLDMRRYEVSTIGQSRVLIQNADLACSKLFNL